MNYEISNSKMIEIIKEYYKEQYKNIEVSIKLEDNKKYPYEKYPYYYKEIIIKENHTKKVLSIDELYNILNSYFKKINKQVLYISIHNFIGRKEKNNYLKTFYIKVEDTKKEELSINNLIKFIIPMLSLISKEYKVNIPLNIIDLLEDYIIKYKIFDTKDYNYLHNKLQEELNKRKITLEYNKLYINTTKEEISSLEYLNNKSYAKLENICLYILESKEKSKTKIIKYSNYMI